MLKIFAALILTWLFCSAHPATAQTYLGVLTSPPNTGPGGSCCSTTATLQADNAQVPTDGSCNGCSVITVEQYQAFHDALDAPRKTKRTSQTKAATGITLTCSTTPSLSGTYRVDNTTMTELLVLANHSLFGNPTIIQTITIADTTGALHTFPSVAVFNNFYGIVAWYWVQLLDAQQRIIAGQAVDFPVATSSAC